MLEVAKQVAIFLIALPIEILYLVLGMCYAKQIKEKRIIFYILLFISGILCSLIARWQLWYYITYIASAYLIMRILYKSHISDLFIFSIFFSWIAVTSYISFIIFDSLPLVYVFQRILMFGTLALRGKFNKWYKTYRELWNRRNDNRIKSVTLRNISLFFLNIFIVFMNFVLIFLNKIFPQ